MTLAKRGLFIFLAGTVLFAGAACSKAGRSSTLAGVLRVALPIEPTQLDPLLSQNTNESFVDGLIFSELVTLDDKGNEVPDLAAVVPTLANGGISKDGLTITYHLRHNVKWQDGVPFTSADVRFSWQALLNPNNNVASRGPYQRISSMDTPDPYTVVLHFKHIFPPAVDTIFGESDSPYRIVPKHLLAKYKNLNQVPFNAAPVGTGPFKFVRWLHGDRIVLAPNPHYFLGAPKLKQIVIEMIADDNTTQAELRAGAIDLAIEINGPMRHALASAPNLRLIITPAPNWEGMLFNMTRAPMNDPAVRRALALGIDAATLSATNEFGTAKVATADLSPFYTWAFDSALQPTPYDQAQAARILDADGWKMGPQDVRVKDGVPLSLQIATGAGNKVSQDISVQVQQALKQIGVHIDVKFYSYPLLYEAAQEGGIFNGGKFDIAFYAWVAGGDPDNSSQWMCDQVPPEGNNISRYCTPAMDAAQRLALSTFDRATRKRAYATIESLLLRDAPGRFFFYPNLGYAVSPELQNFRPNGVSEGWNAYQWSI